jgi:type II secretory pathway pseudopilin PulG
MLHPFPPDSAMNTPAPHSRHAMGFTLVELVAVVAVTAIIGALGVSAYRTYAVRAEIASSIAATESLRDRVSAAFNATGLPPADRQSVGLGSGRDETWGEYVEAVDIVRGRIDLRFGRTADEAIADRMLSLMPFETADQHIVWLCGNKLPGPGLQPLGFSGGAPQPVQVLTPIEVRYLPPNCR